MAIPVPRGRGLECAGEAAGLLDAPVSDSPAQRVSVLVKTIERDVIPRLMLVHRQGAAAAPAPGYTPDAGDVELLVGYLLKGDAAGASAFIRRLRERGATPEVLLLALLAPAARGLGRLWEEDRCDFTVVTMGLWRLQRALHELSAAFQLNAEPPVDGRRILLTGRPLRQQRRIAGRGCAAVVCGGGPVDRLRALAAAVDPRRRGAARTLEEFRGGHHRWRPAVSSLARAERPGWSRCGGNGCAARRGVGAGVDRPAAPVVLRGSVRRGARRP